MFSIRTASTLIVNTIIKRTMLSESINHKLDKCLVYRYLRLPIPPNKIMATYVWIDGYGLNLRGKDRILHCQPQCVEECPDWVFDGSSTGHATTETSDTVLKPCALYKDPFRMEPHIVVLCETYYSDGKPTKTNHRNYCYSQIQKWKSEEPWFGLEQEYTMLDGGTGACLGWPKGGVPCVKHEYSYCGNGALYVVARDIVEAHARACLYSGLAFEGTNAEVAKSSWEWQIGVAEGIKPADDLWMSRYIMNRIAEDFGVAITYHPKPLGPFQPGIGMHHNFSTKTMREDGGYKFIEECMKKLEKENLKHIMNYALVPEDNKLRLTGKFETAAFDKFSWGVGTRATSVRVQKSVKEKGKGYFEDRRPAGDCDPYKVCGLLMETCMEGFNSKSQCPPIDPCKRKC